MHTEIGDFHYFDDDNTNIAGGTTTGNNVTTDNNFSQPADNTGFNQPPQEPVNMNYTPVNSLASATEYNYQKAQEKLNHQSLRPEYFNNGDYRGRVEAFNRVVSRQNMSPMNPDYTQPASLEFDGKNLVWLQNGQPVKYYPAMSGKPDHQTAADTNIPNAGPIPEGDYLLGKGTGQDYSSKEEMSWLNEYIRGHSPWYKNPFAWGKSRIPIQPLPNTNTFGRHSMYVHGGVVPGSAGCIDLTYRNDDFYNDFTKYNGNLPLKVKYPKGW